MEDPYNKYMRSMGEGVLALSSKGELMEYVAKLDLPEEQLNKFFDLLAFFVRDVTHLSIKIMLEYLENIKE